MKLIGVTGNIASGKSTISKNLADTLSVPLINVDDFSKNWVKIYELGVRAMFHRYGIPEIGTVQETLKAFIFKSPDFKSILEEAISGDFWDYISVLQQTEAYDILVIEHPLMFERAETRFFNYIIGVDANYDVRVDRMYKRGYCSETIIERVNNQISFQDYKDKVDVLIDTSDSPTNERVIQQIQNSDSFRRFISETSLS